MILKKVIKIIAVIIAAVVVLAGGFLAFLTATEFKPADVETLKVKGAAETNYFIGDQLTVMSWNIGYGALGDNADFFMDGGEMVKSATEERVQENMDGIMSTIETIEPDLLLVQEVDRDSSRTYHIDEVKMLQERFGGYESTYGINYKTPFVPYPIPPLGKVDSGIMTFTNTHASDVMRVQLPVPFTWPVRAVNLKRCVTETHIPLHDADSGIELGRELVLFNLHLEAYDSGEGKIAQTKMLADLLKAEQAKGNYVIAGGDFNQIFSSTDQNAYPAQADKWQPGELDIDQFGKGFEFLMDEKTPSCRSLDQPYTGADYDSFQFYLIDGFIVSDNIQIDEMKNMNLEFVNSDHNPVVLVFTIKE